MYTKQDYAVLQTIVRLSKSCKMKLIKKPCDELVKMIVYIAQKIIDETFISSLEQRNVLKRFRTGFMKLVKRKIPTKHHREEKKFIRHLSLECFSTIFEIAYENSQDHYKFDEAVIAFEVFLYLHNIRMKKWNFKIE